jgi:hypothetical protein
MTNASGKEQVRAFSSPMPPPVVTVGMSRGPADELQASPRYLFNFLYFKAGARAW